MAHTEDNDQYILDKTRVASAFNRAASQYDDVAVLQQEVGQRMLERLDLIRIAPEYILDIGAGTGQLSRALCQRYKKSTIIALDIAPRMLAVARGRIPLTQRFFTRQRFVCGDAERLPVADQSVDMIFSNLTLQWCNQLDSVFQEFKRVLKPGGLLLFSSFGPDTLKELRSSWHKVDRHTHVNAFIDMHDIGDALTRKGFSDPVMDMENFTLTYRNLNTLMREIKMIGAGNVTSGRNPGLTGKGHLKALIDNYEGYRKDGLLPASYEVIYGHAWALEQDSARQQRADGAVAIPLSELGRPPTKQTR